MVRHDIAIICKLFVADRAYSVLLDNLPVQQLPHLGRRPEFSISSGVVRIFDTLNSKSHRPGFGDEFATAAGKRFVEWAEFIATKPHGIPPGGSRVNFRWVGGN